MIFNYCLYKAKSSIRATNSKSIEEKDLFFKSSLWKKKILEHDEPKIVNSNLDLRIFRKLALEFD